MSSDGPIKTPDRQKAPKTDPARLPMPWARVEEFLRDYARDLPRVGEAVVLSGRGPGRGAAVEVHGPAVFLEMTGTEKRLGAVASGNRGSVPSSPRQRLLLLEPRDEGPHGRLVRVTDLGPESHDLSFDLPKGCGESSRLMSAIAGALENPRYASPDGWEDAAERLSQALRLALAVARAGRRVMQDAANRALRSLRQFERFVAMLKEKHTEELPLPVVAESIGLSPRHFARLLDQWSATGFTEHLLMVRLMVARQRLVQTGATIEEIAGACGFGSRDHFIRAFRQYFGWTPLQFRKHWRAASEGREKWESVLDMPGRHPVEWLPAHAIGSPPQEEAGNFHTMVIANATRQVRVLHRIGTDGAALPEGALQPGEALFIHQAVNHGYWRVDNALAAPVAAFRSPGPRAMAMITA